MVLFSDEFFFLMNSVVFFLFAAVVCLFFWLSLALCVVVVGLACRLAKTPRWWWWWANESKRINQIIIIRFLDYSFSIFFSSSYIFLLSFFISKWYNDCFRHVFPICCFVVVFYYSPIHHSLFFGNNVFTFVLKKLGPSFVVVSVIFFSWFIFQTQIYCCCFCLGVANILNAFLTSKYIYLALSWIFILEPNFEDKTKCP